MIPPKLKKGSHVRVIAPSRSLSLLSQENRDAARQRLEQMGLRMSFGEHVEESDEWVSSSVQSRVADIHAAFLDDSIDGILTVIGGFNVNQILSHLDYSLIKAHPKVLCGFSDITALQHAIYSMTGLVTYSGPHFSTFAMRHGLEYTANHFRKCLFEDEPFVVPASKQWRDDRWWDAQEHVKFVNNTGYRVLQEGEAEGRILGGNVCTLNLLQGSQYMPSLDGAILFLEDDYETSPHTFDRDVQSIMHLPSFSGIRGIVFGRFQKEAKMDGSTLERMFKGRFPSIPVVADADFGHTQPQVTYPVGGTARLEAHKGVVRLEIIEH